MNKLFTQIIHSLRNVIFFCIRTLEALRKVYLVILKKVLKWER